MRSGDRTTSGDALRRGWETWMATPGVVHEAELRGPPRRAELGNEELRELIRAPPISLL
jgi:hypothetical protein